MAGDPPLKGLRVVELAGLAPAPFCGYLLASYGVSVLRIDRPHPLAHPPSHPPQFSSPDTTPLLPPPTADLLTTHKTSICLDLKHSASISLLLSLLPHTDILLDSFRPGVLESLLQPHLPNTPQSTPIETLLQKYPHLILTHLTGFRRQGPYSRMAGHDINYLSVSGILSLLGPSPSSPPSPPANILADFAGGGLVAFSGILLALLRRATTAKGQVVDANMVDGVSALGTFARLGQKVPGLWDGGRGANLLDGGAPYYQCYETKDNEDDGRKEYVAVGALEEKFYHHLIRGLGFNSEKDVLPPGSSGTRNDKANWPHMRAVFERRFQEKTRREWEEVFTGADACVTPVLEMAELEADTGYEVRPMVGLSESPAREVGRQDQWVPRRLRPGEGGEETLREWVGWRRGRDFVVEGGALVRVERREKARL